jgi:hypothetical protein
MRARGRRGTTGVRSGVWCVEWRCDEKEPSSPESVGNRRFWKFAKCMIEGYFHDFA